MTIFRHFILSTLLLCPLLTKAQDGISGDYTEPTCPTATDADTWEKLSDKLYMSWASRDVHYPKNKVPAIKIKKDTAAYAWRGERVGVEALLFSKIATQKLSLRLVGNQRLTANSTARFVNYVLTDDFQGCGSHPTNLTPYLVPDVIDRQTSKAIEAQTVRPVWCTIEIPRDMEAGTHYLKLEILDAAQEVIDTLGLRVEVRNHTLPEPQDQAFHLNFWMQPYAVSRYYNAKPWSEEHFEAMRPYMQMLARAGQCVATAILFYEPWGEQSNDKFEPMVITTKKKDGTWDFDYTIFDRWITFLATCNISKQINCFSMVPWDMNFRYIDERTGQFAYLKTTTSSTEYKQLWTACLKSLASHLKEKGWFDKTCIAMDERGLNDMLNAYNIAQEAVPGMKMALAGNYHQELVDKIYDYCVAWGQRFSTADMNTRNAKGWVSTTYTACPDAQPNLCSNNQPADAAYLPISAISNGFNGFLRWAWMNWTDDPLRDTRFRMFTPGDTYIVYPGGRSGVRFERIIEGVQQAEKVRLLREEYTNAGNQESLGRLNAAVAAFQSGNVDYDKTVAHYVNALEAVLNDSPEPQIEEPTEYCEPTLSPTKRDVALGKRWLQSAVTTSAESNIDYVSSSPSTTGYVLCPQSISARPGSTFRLRVKPTQNDDDLRWCRVALFADWNQDLAFGNTTPELIQRVGEKETNNDTLLDYTFTINVPEDAKPGESRLRLTYADAWGEEPTPCGMLLKGFAFDIPMTISDIPAGIGTIANDHYKWASETLTTSRPVSFSIYSIDGTLIDQAGPACKYSIENYLHGSYILLATDEQGVQTKIKFIKK